MEIESKQRSKRQRSTRTAALAIASLSLGAPRPALADVAACVEAHTSGQREVKAGQLKAASRAFASCRSMEGCPDAIRNECAEFYKDVDRSLPTVIFAAVDEHDADLIQVRVFVGDELVAESLNGRPMAMDPGQQHIKFELASGQIFETDVLVREGEKNRIVSVRAKPAPSPAAQPATSPEHSQTARKLPPAFWVASGVGAAAFASWGLFAVMGHGKQSTVDECSPNCGENVRSDFDAMHRDYVIADISLAVGLVSAGAATWLYLSGDRSSVADQPPSTPAARLTLTPLVTTRSAGLIFNASAF